MARPLKLREILVTYHVLDRFGKETFRSITISVIDGEAEALPDAEGEVRFISEKYYLMGQDEGGLHGGFLMVYTAGLRGPDYGSIFHYKE